MQRVIHEYRNKSRIFNMIEALYSYISDTEYMFESEDTLWLDTSFTKLDKILDEKLVQYRKPLIKNFHFPQVNYKFSRKREITVCLSGGKDSAAAAFYYVKKGYKVHLYHATGVNKAYGDEKKAAEQIAKYLKCDLYIDHICLSGKHQFIEHPLKNYIIANGALHYTLYKGYRPVICFGNFNKSVLDMNEFDIRGGDCIEMWDAYKDIMQNIIPDFDIEIPLETNADTFNLLSDDWKLFTMSVSCMSPYRFRAHWKHRAEQKYKVKLFDNRCGVCWKCCLEEMWLMDHDKKEYDQTFYLHCCDILERTIYRERGYPVETFQEVWDNYMFYPIEESKAYPLIINKKIKGGFH